MDCESIDSGRVMDYESIDNDSWAMDYESVDNGRAMDYESIDNDRAMD